jgi:hypothetical protein
MIAELMSEYGSKLIVAVLGVGLALVCLVGILWIARGRRGPSPFVRGGRNRQPRLQVLDAAAVDARRRLVLVRRDDVEHLIMIGGPSDLVIESRITASAPSVEAPSPEQHTAPAAVAAQVPARPVPAEPAKRPIPVAALRQDTIREPVADISPREIAPAQQPVAIAAAPVATARIEPPAVPVQPQPRAVAPAAAQPALDDAARLLDSQRDRVFAERSVPTPAPAAPVRPATQPNAIATERPTGLGSDFEKILEEEMAHNMAARDASLANRPGRPLPQAGPAVAIPVVTTPGAATKEDPSLQSEVARIFGEMSASRDK